MDTQSQDQMRKELANRIQSDLAGPQHRFELQDPLSGDRHQLANAHAALAKADALGASRLQHVAADGARTEVNLVNGNWLLNDGKPLADLQSSIDRDSASAIEARSVMAADLGSELDAATASQMAIADSHAFQRIQEPWRREDSAVTMASTAQQSPAYKSALERTAPDATSAVAALDAIHDSKVLAKEDRKAFGGMTQSERPGSPLLSSTPGNTVESDEIFTAVQGAEKPSVPSDIAKRYLRVGDKFYHPNNPELVTFEDKGKKLETKSNSEAIAESMVRIAEGRGWDEIKVTGSEVFRKEVWLEAASRGMHVKGYSPSPQDLAQLAKRSPAAAVDQEDKAFRAREKEPPQPEFKASTTASQSPGNAMAQAFAAYAPAEAMKKHPELAGAVASVAAMAMKAEADGLTAEQRVVVAARVRQNVINSIERGTLPQVNIREVIEIQRDIQEDREYTR